MPRRRHSVVDLTESPQIPTTSSSRENLPVIEVPDECPVVARRRGKQPSSSSSSTLTRRQQQHEAVLVPSSPVFEQPNSIQEEQSILLLSDRDDRQRAPSQDVIVLPEGLRPRDSNAVMDDEALARLLQDQEYASLSTILPFEPTTIASSSSDSGPSSSLSSLQPTVRHVPYSRNPTGSPSRRGGRGIGRGMRGTRGRSEAFRRLMGPNWMEASSSLTVTHPLNPLTDILGFLGHDAFMGPFHHPPEDNFDDSYESLLALGEQIGEVKSKALPESVFESLPWKRYSEKNFDPESAKCTICLCDYEPKDKIKGLPCNHWFHTDCIKQWFEQNSKCPICRMDVTAQGPSSSSS